VLSKFGRIIHRNESEEKANQENSVEKVPKMVRTVNKELCKVRDRIAYFAICHLSERYHPSGLCFTMSGGAVVGADFVMEKIFSPIGFPLLLLAIFLV
jgi:hypothetical protein